MEFYVRMIVVGSLALALAACSGGGSGSGEGEANAAGAVNMGSDPNMTVDQPGEVDELLNLEADESRRSGRGEPDGAGKLDEHS